MAQPMIFDAEVSEVSEGNLGNLVTFPETFPGNPGNVYRKPLGNPSEVSEVSDYSSTDLASAVGVSRQAWARDWFPHLAAVVGESPLRIGRRYSKLCSELNLSLQAARRSGQSASAWVAAAVGRRSDLSIEEHASNVAMAASVAIVPVAVEQVHNGQALALTQAVQLQDVAQILLGRVHQALQLNAIQVNQTNRSIEDATIIAQETARILHEEQLKAAVRADFEAKRNAAIAQQLQADLAQLQGGQHG